MYEKKNELEHFFEEITRLKEEYSNAETFNPYLIFGLKDKEIMHSRFIKSLLNPDEIHGFKHAFLDLFLKRIEITGFNLISVTTECEKNTFNNRFIDIAIENKKAKQMIIIENKIWANDLDNQLSDYYNFALNLCDGKSENLHVVYLTPYGRQPNAISFPKENEQPKNGIRCISYEKDILDWLDDCLKHIRVKDEKNVRLLLCIEMYIELIRKTINRDKYMEEILKLLMNDSEKMKIAIDVARSLQGRNFFEINSISRNKIIDNLILSFEELGIEHDNYEQDEAIYYFDKINGDSNCDIIIEKNCIYGENDNIKTVNKSLEILGNDLNNKYLIALLTNDQPIIQEWITETIKYLTGKAEN
jgi:hypothetical protein